MGVGGRHALATFTPGKDSGPIVQEVGWPPGPVLIRAENLAPTGIQSPDLPACSESLHRLRYPGPFRDWRLSEINGCNKHATPNTSHQKSSCIFKILTIHVSQARMVQSELLLGYGLNDLEFESWQGQVFTKHRLALGPSQSPIRQELGFSSRDKGLWHEVDHIPPSSAEVIKAWSCISTPPTWPHSVDRDNLFFPIHKSNICLPTSCLPH